MKRAHTTLLTLLSSDEDMAAMYLSHRSAAGRSRHIDDHTEVELMLESYAAGSHMVHSHTVHLPLGALLIWYTMCGTGEDHLRHSLRLPCLVGAARLGRRRELHPAVYRADPAQAALPTPCTFPSVHC